MTNGLWILKNLKLEGEKTPSVKFVNPIEGQLQRMKQVQEDAIRSMAEEKQKEERYNQDVLNTLRNIEKNTGDISSLVSLVQSSGDKQDEIINVLKKVMEISQAKTEEEADTLYRNVMDNANQLNEDVETATKLIGFGKIVWLAVKEYLKNPS